MEGPAGENSAAGRQVLGRLHTQHRAKNAACLPQRRQGAACPTGDVVDCGVHGGHHLPFVGLQQETEDGQRGVAARVCCWRAHTRQRACFAGSIPTQSHPHPGFPFCRTLAATLPVRSKSGTQTGPGGTRWCCTVQCRWSNRSEPLQEVTSGRKKFVKTSAQAQGQGGVQAAARPGPTCPCPCPVANGHPP